ncbi:hypothetical protein HUJ04_011331, partial [Dendroctonus ponderosae]
MYLGESGAEVFRNRKGYISINVQAIGDADLKLINVVARWPGSTHDATIFNNSKLKVCSYMKSLEQWKRMHSAFQNQEQKYCLNNNLRARPTGQFTTLIAPELAVDLQPQQSKDWSKAYVQYFPRGSSKLSRFPTFKPNRKLLNLDRKQLKPLLVSGLELRRECQT